MKKSICIIIFFLTHIVWGQSLYLIISSNNEPANYLRNLNYTKQHKNVKQLFEEANTVLKTIQKNGYLESSMLPITRLNDSTFTSEIDFGKQTQFIHIYIGTENNSLIGQNHSEITLPFGESENFLNDVMNKLENNGFSLAKVKLKTLVSKNDTLHAELDLQLDKKRVLNSIVVNGMDKFPVGFKKQLERLYKNKTFNTENLKKLSADIDQLGFVQQIKFPEVLFTKSNTDIYIYVEKSKSNSFDGFIGFNTNDKNTLVLNGYLDLSLQNILNSGEKMALNWKSNGSNQKDFQLSVELPFAFNSPVALKTQLRIFKQDTTFQNTNTHIGLGYYFTAHSKLFLNYESAESSDIQNANTALLNDFTNTFITADYNFSKHSTDFGAFKESNFINLKIGSGKRQAKTSDNTQFYGAVSAQYNWYLNPKNCIALKSQNYYLQSDQYITNELYRFGGINSIRGFTENSLQGNLFTSFSTEYRYSVAPTLYVHSIVDYGYYKDSTRNWDDRILGLGFGFGIVTKNGLFHLVYANGSSQNQTLKLNNSIVQISLKTRF